MVVVYGGCGGGGAVMVYGVVVVDGVCSDGGLW